jgi:eukaryotic-like serine/threonine-protein kinase
LATSRRIASQSFEGKVDPSNTAVYKGPTNGFAVTLEAGRRLGPYEIVAPLGAGGMGEVYRARDSRLNRDVAVKILLPAVADDPERLARFRREAQVLASLNHHNIAHIHGIEDTGGHWALIMELADGPTLADRLERGAVALDETLEIARQMAEALEAAHERGIIHRDLKPANVKVLPDGTVKVLDFGLAKAVEQGTAGTVPGLPGNFADSPTMSVPGAILGTAAYMSPEQAKGKTVDKRADLWSFGCVLYEMLGGRRPFEGGTVSEVLAKIIEREPDWNALPRNTPSSIRTLLRRCLEKDPRRRLDSAAVARLEIDEALTPSAAIEPAPPHAQERVRVAGLSAWALIAVALAALTGAVTTRIVTHWSAASTGGVTRFAITLSPAQPLSFSINDRDLALSPDGTRIVYTAGDQSQLFVRAFDQLEPAALAGIVNARAPFLSPDGRWIGFFDELDEGVTTGPVVRRGALRKVPIDGGPSVLICRITGASRGASWGPDDSIVFATSDRSTGLLRVPAGGGEPTVLTKPDGAEGDHYFPLVLPGGRAVLFTVAAGTVEERQVAVLDLKTGQRTTLLRSGSQPEYLDTGHLIYTDSSTLSSTLWVVGFDLRTLSVRGDPVPLGEQVLTLGAADFAVSRSGTLVYVPVRANQPRSLVWLNRKGVEEPIAAPPRGYVRARLSPDETRIALQIQEKSFDVWTWDIRSAKLTRLTFGSPGGFGPTWTPDGRQIIFGSPREGPNRANLFRRSADGGGVEERLTTSNRAQRTNAVSPDGRRLVFEELTPSAGYDLMLLSLDKSLKVEALLQTAFDERNAAISPDGRWMAYESNESGQSEIYVRPFPNVDDARYQISNSGGRAPVWANDGHELVFVNRSSVMSVAIQMTPTFSAGNAIRLFEAHSIILDGRFGGAGTVRTYDVSRDGQRFLMVKDNAVSGERAAPPAMIVVQNWLEELKRRLRPGENRSAINW